MHTKGPWEVRLSKEPEYPHDHYIWAEGYGVIGYWQPPDKFENPQWILKEEDAHLIAAAPELLEALEKMLQRYGYETCEYVKLSQVAINKAKGEIKCSN